MTFAFVSLTRFVFEYVTPLDVDVWTGLGFIGSAALMFFREILLSPRQGGVGTFPCASRTVRAMLWVTATAMVLIGMLFIFHEGRRPFAGQACLYLAILSTIFVAHQLVYLHNIWRERRPLEVWEKRAHIDAVAGFHHHDGLRMTSRR